jgi:Domain of unknown function (DUF4166)
MSSMSLYQRVLGPRFEKLPEVLQRFHGSTTGGQARGTFLVERGKGWLRNAVASLFGFPKAGQDVSVRLEVIVEGDRERWFRHFPGGSLSSLQSADGGLLIESFGLGSFAFELVIDGSRLRHEFRRAWFAGIPLPRVVAPFVDGWVDAGDTGWLVVVHIVFPLLGEIVHYEGWVEP